MIKVNLIYNEGPYWSSGLDMVENLCNVVEPFLRANTEAAIHTNVHTYGQFVGASWSNMRVFGLWKTEHPVKKPFSHGEPMKTPYKKAQVSQQVQS